jgi:hypothetical protein
VAERDIVFELIEERRGDALRTEAAELERLADKADRANGSLGHLGEQSRTVSQRMDEQRGKVRDLAKEIDKLDDGPERSGLVKKFSAANRELAQLKKLAEALKPDPEPASKSLMQSLSAAASAATESFTGPLVAAAVAAAPLIGAALAGALGTAVGGGVLAAGVLAAAQDPRVKDAGTRFAETFKGAFVQAGSSFVEPVLTALDHLQAGIAGLHLDEMFAQVAPSVVKLTDGVIGFAHALADSLNSSMGHAVPLLDEFAALLPGLGADLGEMIDTIVSSKGALEGLHAAFMIAGGGLRFFGETVAWLGDRFHDLSAAQDWYAQHILGDTVGHLGILVPGFQRAATGADGLTASQRALGDASIGAARAFDQQTGSLQAWNSAQMGAQNASLAAASDVLALKDAVNQHGASLASNTQEGISNQQMLLGLANDYMLVRDKNLEQGMGVDAANAKYQEQMAQLQSLATKLGLSKDKVNELIGAYLKIPPGPFVTTVETDYITHGTPGEHSGPRINELQPKKRALGGRANAGEPYIVGDGGRPELFVPSSNGYIMPRVPTGQGGSGGGGVRTAPIYLNGAGLGDLVWGWIQKEVRTQHGGDVVVAFGGRR